MPMNEVKINIKHHRDLGELSNFRHGLENFPRCGSGLQTALRRKLVDQSIGQRIAERDPEFQHIYAEFIKGQRQLSGGVQIRISRPDISDESLASFPLELVESFH